MGRRCNNGAAANDGTPPCRFHCLTCKKEDCDYDGDYVSRTERFAAQRRDHLALWYRLPWSVINKQEEKKAYNKVYWKAYYERLKANGR